METLGLLCTILLATSTQVVNGMALPATLELETSDFVTIDRSNRYAHSEHVMSVKEFRLVNLEQRGNQSIPLHNRSKVVRAESCTGSPTTRHDSESSEWRSALGLLTQLLKILQPPYYSPPLLTWLSSSISKTYQVSDIKRVMYARAAFYSSFLYSLHHQCAK